MKLKRVFRIHLVIVLLGCLVIGLGMPNDAEALTCNIKGYVVDVLFVKGTLSQFYLREKPIDAGFWVVAINEFGIPTSEELALYHAVRSAHQNNTKLGVSTTINNITKCPTPDLSVPGATSAGTLIAVFPPSLL